MLIPSLVGRIRNHGKRLRQLTDSRLRQTALDLKYRAMTGCHTSDLIVPGFSLVVESCRRCSRHDPYNVQLECAIHLTRGRIAEMKTGEGKTLTASLAAFVLALNGQGLHLVTFNDYLARRDHDHLKPVYELLGMTVGVLEQNMSTEQKRNAYQCDITYGAAKEFGFDFLRDRLAANKTAGKSGVMRGLNFALVDEADSILIDEARTPMVIGSQSPHESKFRIQCFRWAAQHAARFHERIHFRYDELQKRVELNSNGVQLARSLPPNDGIRRVSLRDLYDYIETAVKVHRDFRQGKNYAMIDGDVVIIDEFTGRPAEGRQWQNGIHQAVQAKEDLKITPTTRQAASITIQSFFKRYPFFCGMTGTAWTSRKELQKVYRKRVVRIPPNRPVRRSSWPSRVFKTESEKFTAIADSVHQMITIGRAVLIGTRSIEKSERLAKRLRQFEIVCQVLNANQIEREAELVSAAGLPGAVTVATNMAGRGTDIKLDPDVLKAGGLHVILSEIHEAARIDWQLIGRGSRQGDPGSYQIFAALDDEILITGLGVEKAKQLASRIANHNSRLDQYFPLFRKAQRCAEQKQLVDRLMILKMDQERAKPSFETGTDPVLNVVSG